MGRAWGSALLRGPWHSALSGRGLARLGVHEFLLAVNDNPEKFELLMLVRAEFISVLR